MPYQQIRNLKKAVGEILKTYEHTRNDDRALVKIVCDTYGLDPIAKASSIERCRRWYNQKPRLQYLPTDLRVARGRGINEDEWRVAVGYPVQASVGTEHPIWIPPSEQHQAQLL